MAANRSASRWNARAKYYACDARETHVDNAPESEMDLLIVNPPRAGLKSGIARIDVLSPRHIFMMSCNLSTLSTDLKALEERGYRAEQLSGYDMFPFTNHREITVFMSRG